MQGVGQIHVAIDAGQYHTAADAVAL